MSSDIKPALGTGQPWHPTTCSYGTPCVCVHVLTTPDGESKINSDPFYEFQHQIGSPSQLYVSVRRCLEQEVKILSQVGGMSNYLQIFHGLTANNKMLERLIEKAFDLACNLNCWESETFFHFAFEMLLSQ